MFCKLRGPLSAELGGFGVLDNRPERGRWMRKQKLKEKRFLLNSICKQRVFQWTVRCWKQRVHASTYLYMSMYEYRYIDTSHDGV